MIEYEIEKGIPVPEETRKGERAHYPFYKMGVGDSFSVTSEDCKRAQGAAWSFSHRYGAKFTTKKQPDGSVRVWRFE